MKTYGVRLNHAEGLVELIAFESKAVDCGAVTYQRIEGPHGSIYFTSTRKKECLAWIKNNIPADWDVRDVADYVYEQYGYGRHWKKYHLGY